jgi:hypothetical protein
MKKHQMINVSEEQETASDFFFTGLSLPNALFSW